MKGMKKVFLCLAMLIVAAPVMAACSNGAPTSTSAVVDTEAAVGTTDPVVAIPKGASVDTTDPAAVDTTVPATTAPDNNSVPVTNSEKKNDDGGSKWRSLGIWLSLFAVVGCFVLFLWIVRSDLFRAPPSHEKLPLRREPRQQIDEPPTPVKPLNIVDPLTQIQQVAPKAPVDPKVLTVVEPPITARPILSTTAQIPTISNQPESKKPINGSESTKQARTIISPPQIADPSSFARHDWWDKDREWCQVSPLGMSNDAVCDIGTSGALAIAAVSLRGHKHKVDSKACQDAFSLRVATSQSGEKFLIVVVCDGMSSAKYSHYGARRTSQLLARSLAEIISFEESVVEQSIRSRLPKAFEICRKILVPRSGNQYGAPDVPADGAVESDFYTTVTFMILPSAKQANGRVNVIVGSIGDSPVFALRAQIGEWEEIGGLGTNADIVNPATSAFPAVIDARITTVVIDEQDVIIATSDGVGNFLNVRGGQTLLGSYLAQQWIRPVNLPTFINDVGFDLRSADDDRTVVAIWPNRG